MISIPQNISAIISFAVLMSFIPLASFAFLKWRKKKLSTKKLSLSIVISSIIFLGFIYQATTGKIQAQDDSILISSGFYSKSISKEDITSFEVSESFNEKISWRVNGLSFIGIKHGYFFGENDASMFLILNNPPYAVLHLKNNEVVAFSVSKNDIESLKKSIL
ncbi:hypothetical protein KY023_003280 [Vibrio vulnificus]|nr:hypothetical protein [Vibrio vulnificus]